VVYNAKSLKTASDYEQYLKKKKVALVRSRPYVKSMEVYRIDKVVGPAVANPKDPPSDPPYQFVAKIEVTNLEDYAKAAQTPEMQEFIGEYSAYIDQNGPLNVFTVGHSVEPVT
jgi:hypothetical protein